MANGNNSSNIAADMFIMYSVGFGVSNIFLHEFQTI